METKTNELTYVAGQLKQKIVVSSPAIGDSSVATTSTNRWQEIPVSSLTTSELTLLSEEQKTIYEYKLRASKAHEIIFEFSAKIDLLTKKTGIALNVKQDRYLHIAILDIMMGHWKLAERPLKKLLSDRRMPKESKPIIEELLDHLNKNY